MSVCMKVKERKQIVYMVYVDECMYECERVCRLFTGCMQMSVCMKVKERKQIVYMVYVDECVYESEREKVDCVHGVCR